MHRIICIIQKHTQTNITRYLEIEEKKIMILLFLLKRKRLLDQFEIHKINMTNKQFHKMDTSPL